MLKEKTQRVVNEERQNLLNEAEELAGMGSWKWVEAADELVWSKGLYRIFGKNPEEPVSWTAFLENVLPEDIVLVEDFLYEVKNNRKGSSIDYRIIKNGELHHLSLTAKPHSVLNIDILGAVVDISDRKRYATQLEEFNLSHEKIIHELNENEKKYRSLFERSIDPIFLATAKFNLVDVNESFLKLFEYSSEEELTLQDVFVHEKDYTHLKDTLRDVEQIRNFEVVLRSKSGEHRLCLVNCVFIPDQASEFCFYQGIIHDLTHRKQAESDMLTAERFSLTGKMARTIAHEVRNPLTNLNLALDQLRDEMPPINDTVALYYDIIQRNANRIEQLVEEMLNSSKPKELTLELNSLQDILEGTIIQAIDRIKLNQIELHTQYQENLPSVMVDKAKIQIALLNIIINAIEAMIPGKGVLKIQTSQRDNQLIVSITDNGKGISDADLGKLFDPFFTGKHNGMGLGLTSVKNILNSHNAQVIVESELEKGTTFYIRFTVSA